MIPVSAFRSTPAPALLVFKERRSAPRFDPQATVTLASTLDRVARAARPPAPAATARDLEAKGLQLLRHRRFWIPLLTSPYVAVSADVFARRLEEGATDLAVASADTRPAAVRSSRDLEALRAIYLSGNCGPIAASLAGLERAGCRFGPQGDLGGYGAWRALDQGRQVAAGPDGAPLLELAPADLASPVVARMTYDAAAREYAQMRAIASKERPEEGLALFRKVRSLPLEQRPAWLALQEATHEMGWTAMAWETIQKTGLPLDESVALMAAAIKGERSIRQAQEELEAVARWRRPGETVTEAAAALDRIRLALPPDKVIHTCMAFVGMRMSVAPGEEALYFRLIERSGDGLYAGWRWDLIKKAGPAHSFERRAGLIMEQPVDLWPDLCARIRHVDGQIPPGVDRVRGEEALLPVLTLAEADCAERVRKALDGRGDARTARFEWLCAVMAAAGTVADFDRALAAAARPGNPAEREAAVRGLLENTRGTDAALRILDRIDRAGPSAFASLSHSAIALTAALRGRGPDAASGFVAVLDARDRGELRSESLDESLARFAAAYSARGSVDEAMARLRAPEADPAARIERQDDGLVVGGIRVPRKRPADGA